MKKIILLLTVITITMLVFFLTGCAEEDTMSINDRIREFVSDLNLSNRDGIKEHLHSDCSVSNSANEAYWESKFTKTPPSYSVGSITETGSKTRNVVINGGVALGNTFSFTMKEEDSDDWYILSISGAVNVP